MADETKKADQAAAAAGVPNTPVSAVAADAPPAQASKAAQAQPRAAATSNPDAAAAAMTPARPGRRPGPAETAAPAQVDTQALGSAIAAGYAQIQARREQLTATEGMDKTVPHGCYIVEGKVVNAHGEELDLDPEDLEEMPTYGPATPTTPAPLRRDRPARRQPETKEV